MRKYKNVLKHTVGLGSQASCNNLGFLYKGIERESTSLAFALLSSCDFECNRWSGVYFHAVCFRIWNGSKATE